MYTSGHLSRRTQMFDRFVDATYDAATNLDLTLLEPSILSQAQQLPRAAIEMFLPNISNNGMVEIPADRQDTNGFAVIPLLSSKEVLCDSPSMLRPTPARLALMEARSGVSAEVFEAQLDEGIAIAQAKSDWTSEINISSNSAAETSSCPAGFFRFETQAVPLESRPYIIVSPDLTNMRSPIQKIGAAGVHELLHGLDNDLLWRNKSFANYEQNELRTLHARNESRGYHITLASLLSRGKDLDPRITKSLRSAKQMEELRIANVDPDDPFEPNGAMIKKMVEWKVIP